METSTLFAIGLVVAGVIALVIFVLPKLKKDQPSQGPQTGPTVNVPSGLVGKWMDMIDNSVPKDTHAEAIAALQGSTPVPQTSPTITIPTPIAAAQTVLYGAGGAGSASPTGGAGGNVGQPGQQYDIHGRPIAPAPYGRDNYGNPFSSQEQADRWRAAVAKQKTGETARDEAHDRQVYEGPIPIAAITRWNAQTDGWDFSVRDSDYLNWAATVDGPSVWSAVCSGPTLEIGRAINESAFHFNYLQSANVDIDASYTGPCRQYRELFRAGALKPKYHLE